ncbi:MAG: glycosyltransferase family 39 protein [Caldilineaceae bacterium]
MDRRWLWAGILTLLLVGGFFRFTTLGYAEYQGDEARAALRAAAVLQGYDDVLLIHKKGPTEIALPTVAYALTGTLTEQMARFPFAVANLAALFAVFLLGWRMFTPLAGWIAAMLFALDGYFIGFSRIVQYQSVVFLVSILTVMVLYRLVQQPRALTRYLTLAAMLLATGLLSHYEAALAGLPAAFLLGVLIWQNRPRWREIVGATVIGGVVGVVLLALFYVPFVRHPQFSATYTYLSDRRMGGQFPYNNLADFFLRTTVYSTTYYVLILIGLTIVALAIAFGRAFGKTVGALTAALLGALMVITFWNPTWLTVGGMDLAVVPFALVLGAVVFLPRMSTAERTLWLWFGAGMLLAIFFTEKPRTHVYTFFLPWLILCGWTGARLWLQLRNRVGTRPALLAGSATAAVLVLVFGSYAYWYFIHNDTEVLRTWDNWHPAAISISTTSRTTRPSSASRWPTAGRWSAGSTKRASSAATTRPTRRKRGCLRGTPAASSAAGARPTGTSRSTTWSRGTAATRRRWSTSCATASPSGASWRSTTPTAWSSTSARARRATCPPRSRPTMSPACNWTTSSPASTVRPWPSSR